MNFNKAQATHDAQEAPGYFEPDYEFGIIEKFVTCPYCDSKTQIPDNFSGDFDGLFLCPECDQKMRI